MNTSEFKSKYLSFIETQSQHLNNEMNHKVIHFANSILDFILTYPDMNALTELDFTQIKKIVSSNEIESIQYTLYLLALEPNNVIKWINYAESNNFYEPERHYFEEDELTDILLNKDFYNPFTGEEISQEEFSSLVNTVFAVSDDFKQSYKKFMG